MGWHHADHPCRPGSGIVADRDQGIADHLGVQKSQYLDWLETEGLPRCGATTAKGERCRDRVSGGIQRPLEEWLQETEVLHRPWWGEVEAWLMTILTTSLSVAAIRASSIVL